MTLRLVSRGSVSGCSIALVMALQLGCIGEIVESADGRDDETDTGNEVAGDGDGDPTGGDADGGSSTGDGDPSTGDGDGDPSTGDGDGDCMLGSEGCVCTVGGGCDQGLVCDAGVCVAGGGGDGDGDPTGDGDGDPTGDGDGDATGDGDGDGVNETLYGACPNGVDQCFPGETCIKGNAGGQAWSLCTSGTCNFNYQCSGAANTRCANPPGDNSSQKYCVPQTCFSSTCPNGMACFTGTFADNTCLWPG